MYVCVCVCLFSIEIQTTGRMGMKWGFDPEPQPPRVHKGGTGCLWSLSHSFWQKLYKQKLQGAPDLVGTGHLFGPQIRKDLGPMSFWSHVHSYWGKVYNTKVVGDLTNSYLVRLDTPYPDPRVHEAQKGGLVGFWSLSRVFWRTLYKTKVAGHTQLSGGRSPLWTPNLDLEGPGPGVLLEPWPFTFKSSL